MNALNTAVHAAHKELTDLIVRSPQAIAAAWRTPLPGVTWANGPEGVVRAFIADCSRRGDLQLLNSLRDAFTRGDNPITIVQRFTKDQ